MNTNIRELSINNFIEFSNEFIENNIEIKNYLLTKDNKYVINLSSSKIIKQYINYFYKIDNIIKINDNINIYFKGAVVYSKEEYKNKKFNNLYEYSLLTSYPTNLYHLIKNNKTSFLYQEYQDLFIFIFDNLYKFKEIEYKYYYIARIFFNYTIGYVLNPNINFSYNILINHEEILKNGLITNNNFLKYLQDNYLDNIFYIDTDTIIFYQDNEDIKKIFDNSIYQYEIKKIEKLYYQRVKNYLYLYNDGTYRNRLKLQDQKSIYYTNIIRKHIRKHKCQYITN